MTYYIIFVSGMQIIIRYLYTLQSIRHQKSSYHLSPHSYTTFSSCDFKIHSQRLSDMQCNITDYSPHTVYYIPMIHLILEVYAS